MQKQTPEQFAEEITDAIDNNAKMQDLTSEDAYHVYRELARRCEAMANALWYDVIGSR